MKLFKRILRTAFLAPFAIIMGVEAGNGTGANSNLDSTNAEPTNQQGSNSDPTQNNNSGNQQQEKTFTQAEVNVMMAKEKDQGRKAILKELGVEDVKNAKDALDRYKEYLESQKTDLQKAQDAAAETEENRKLLEEELVNANQKLAVLTAGCSPDKAEDVCVLARARMSEKTTFEQAVEQVKEGYPDLFGQQSQSKGTGNNVNPQNRGGTQNNGGFGQRLASQHKTEAKNPYFNE